MDDDFEECDFCGAPWEFQVRYPTHIDRIGTAMWLCKPCAEGLPVDYRPYVEAKREEANAK